MQDNLEIEVWMNQALALARAGVGLSTPNPNVGALIVNIEGKVVGSATHTYEGVGHAEDLALQQAGESARGGTLVVNIEPCSHTGRTGPCVERIIGAGVARVVAAMRDPNPVVSGKGFARLRSAGIEVVEGIGSTEAKRVNEAFAKYILQKIPLVTLKAGMTLDGKIAPSPGAIEERASLARPSASGGWITSEAARAEVQRMRHASDAIMVGVGTVIADDPLLTDRSGLPRRRPLLRVVLDSKLRIPLESRLVQTANQDLMVCCSFVEEKKKLELEQIGVRVERLPLNRATELQVAGGPPVFGADGRPDLADLIRRLGELEITSLMIEGGATVNWAALASGIVDKVFLFYAPKILAGTRSLPFAGGEGFPAISSAAHVKDLSIHRFDEDFAVEGYLKNPYEGESPAPLSLKLV